MMKRDFYKMISNKRSASAILVAAFIVCAAYMVPKEDRSILDDNMRVFKLLESFGYDAVDHFPNTDIFGVSAKRGETLIKEGFSTRPGGGRTKKQSKHFVCTSCHNLEREDPDLSQSDPQARLVYTNEKGLPFLQGTSLYGAVNREQFYNGDYYKKYGDLVIPAREDIREAIQLCAVECAQGRKLQDWELESILAYLWTIDLKIEDLDLDEEQLQFIEKSYKTRVQQDSAKTLLLSKYKRDSPATFTTAYDSKLAVEALQGDTDNGKIIYENSCLHCHAEKRYSYFLLDDEDITFKHLAKKSVGYTDHSIFQATRYGIYSVSGRRSYMPQYPLEKMSNQQLADLNAYIQMRAGK